ncbi:LysE family translocator [Kushneria indalinina]|uniref:Threonine/homoserine/homoserine lactone efflux protein n=1 Tax=Kushneria indalinina DSM 14324 TaxID=1122140 RepID=A0A3D9DWP1_9GAMM|nr:LysE family translocator [Kushneria indalinina]REC95198.1 threonine/homoserine/homoserine lactone efflux protein [Kushneria indalinina DSM 14324]
MLGIHDLTIFMFSGLILNMTPGPDSLLIVSRTAMGQWQHGAVTALGVSTGTLVHVLAAAAGLSAILATSAMAFTLVKWVGAIYLIWLGLSALFKRRRQEDRAPVTHAIDTRLFSLFRQGLLTNVLNPKVALFFMAFMPQFIDPAASLKPLAFLTLGLIFDVVATLWSAVLITIVTLGGQRLRPGVRLRAWLERSVGVMFVALGIRLALTRTPSPA